MKLAVALLVLADLLLRGAAVPHVHASDAGDHAQSLRPHVHVTWHGGDHGHTHHVDNEGTIPRHAFQSHAESHDHLPPDDTAIYLDDGVMLFTAADQFMVARPVVSWITPLADALSGAPTDSGRMATGPRPPGSRAASIHDLLPHVLRM